MLQIKEEDEKKSSWRRRVNDTPETETKNVKMRREGREGEGCRLLETESEINSH